MEIPLMRLSGGLERRERRIQGVPSVLAKECNVLGYESSARGAWCCHRECAAPRRNLHRSRASPDHAVELGLRWSKPKARPKVDAFRGHHLEAVGTLRCSRR